MIVGLISEGYTRTLGIPLKAGRELTEQEVARGEQLALINESASKLWPAGASPIGKLIRLDFLVKPGGPVLTRANTPYVTVAGVIGNTKNGGLNEETTPAAFVPYTLLAPPQRMIAIRSHSRSAWAMT